MTKDKDENITHAHANDSKADTKADSKADKAEKTEAQKLADQGIYKPHDQIANAPATTAEVTASDEDKELHENHRKNLAKLPPVPAERAGAASQAK